VNAKWIGGLVPVFGLGLVADAGAIVIRDDVPDADYVVADEDYPALVDLFEPGDCIGSLVHESYVLTVAHCAMDLSAGETLDVAGTSHAIADVILHPEWEDIEDFDIALVRFEEPVVGVDPLPLYRDTAELDAVVTLVGRGTTATGLEGEAGGSTDGLLRRANNVVSGVEEHFIEIYFESPEEPGVLPLEGVGAAGDSGCPVFIEVDGVAQIAGLNSYGDFDAGGGVALYGSWDYQTRVSTYLDWIDEVVGDAPANPGDDDDDDDDDDDVEDESGGGDESSGGGADDGSDDGSDDDTGDETGGPFDTGMPSGSSDEDASGCSCRAGSPTVPWLSALLGLLVVCRRQASRSSSTRLRSTPHR